MRVSERERKIKREGESERAKDKTGDMHLRGIQMRGDPDWRVCVTSKGENKQTNNGVDFAETENPLNASFSHLFCFPSYLY